MKNMYKLLVLLLVLVTSVNYAQTNKYGIRAGLGIPNLNSKDDNIYSKDYESVLGFDGGIFADFGITERFSIKAELAFTRKGGERKGVQPIPPTTLPPELSAIAQGRPIWADFDNNEAIFSYIEIPILAKYEWSLGKTWGIYVNAGPYIDFMIDPVQKTSGVSAFYYDEAQTIPFQVPANPTDPPQDWFWVDLPPQDLGATTDISEELATVDFGAMWGLGFTAEISEHSELFFDIRGSYGFIALQKDTDTYGTVHMGNLSFAVGYTYVVPKKTKIIETTF